MNRSALCLASALFLALAGCSTMKTTEVTLDPVPHRAVPDGKEVVIDSVTDERTVADLPAGTRVDTHAVPVPDSRKGAHSGKAATSQGTSGASRASGVSAAPSGSGPTAGRQPAAVAGLGNVVASDNGAQFALGSGASVPDWVRGLVVAGLARTGYRVVSAQEATPRAIHISVAIRKLWAWKPTDGEKTRNWAKEMKSVVETTVTAQGKASVVIPIHAEAVHPLQIFNEENVDISYRLMAANYVRVFQQQVQGKL